MRLPCEEYAVAGNLSELDHLPVEVFILWLSHHIRVPGLHSVPASPPHLKLAENLGAVLFLESAQSNLLLNTESIWLASNEAADRF